jgi:Flp pilus assembly protein TadB
MDEKIRISDSDRERIATRLRDFFAEGRLTTEELDERITATLNAKTAGDLRQVMKDLPQASDTPSWSGQSSDGPTPSGPMPPWAAGRRGPWAMRRRYRVRLLPLILLTALVLLLVPGAGFVFSLIFKLVLAFWLVVMLAGLFAVVRFRRRIRRMSRTGYWHTAWQGGHHHWRDW